jgi:hypothetical protein
MRPPPADARLDATTGSYEASDQVDQAASPGPEDAMTFPKVDMTRAFKHVKKQIDEAQHADAYRDHEARYDKLVIDTLQTVVDRSVEVLDDFYRFVDEKHALGKKLIGEMDALVKRAGKSIGPNEIKILETSARNLTKTGEAIKSASDDIYDAVGTFRGGGWQSQWKTLLSDQKLIDAFDHYTFDTMSEGKVRAGLMDRIDEYVKRGAAVLAAAKHAAGQADADHAAQVVAFGKHAKEVETSIKIAAKKADALLKPIRELNVKTKLPLNELKEYRNRLIAAQKEMKSIRGMLKTLEIKTEAFKKLARDFDAQQKQSAAGALETAAKVTKSALASHKSLTKAEAESAKALDRIAKLK